MAPASMFASSLNPNVAYLESNFPALWKKQTILPSLAYAGMPYQVFGERAGAAAVMIAWSRLAMARSVPFISATFSSRAFSPSALAASAFSSLARSFIAARSAAVNPLVEPVRFVVARFVAVFFSAITSTSSGKFLDAHQGLPVTCVISYVAPEPAPATSHRTAGPVSTQEPDYRVGERQRGGQARRFDAEQIHETRYTVLARSCTTKSAAGAPLPEILGRMPA